MQGRTIWRIPVHPVVEDRVRHLLSFGDLPPIQSLDRLAEDRDVGQFVFQVQSKLVASRWDIELTQLPRTTEAGGGKCPIGEQPP